MTTIRKFIAMILFVSMYALRNKSLPYDELTSYIVSQTYAEPWGNMPRNAWAWADTEVAEAWTKSVRSDNSVFCTESVPYPAMGLRGVAAHFGGKYAEAI